ncbi:MAG: TetR/AcrR family transcriptional regulator [Lysobacterales bacterium]
MPRPPKARARILDAAERVVKTHGAAKLTFEGLVQESGISRGGITYHFATKEDLLRALIERDLAQSQAEQSRHAAQSGDEPGAELIALIRTWSRPDSERRRFVAGMLSAVAHDPSLLDPIRCHHQQECAARTWNDDEIQRSVLRLAAEGLFWSEYFGCSEVPAEHRDRIVARMEQLAREWSLPREAVRPVPASSSAAVRRPRKSSKADDDGQ